MNTKFVFDSTPLIYLSKTKVLEKLKALNSQNLIPHLVYEEVVVKGIEQGHSDARYILRLIEDKQFKIMDCPTFILSVTESKNISSADKSVLIVAQKQNGVIIADDEELRMIASSEGIENYSSLYLLMKLCRKNILTKLETKKHCKK